MNDDPNRLCEIVTALLALTTALLGLCPVCKSSQATPRGARSLGLQVCVVGMLEQFLMM